MNSNYDFVNEKTSKALFKMFMPMMIGMILNLAYNLVDSLWIGNLLGDTALAALTNATPIVTLLFSFGMGITNGMSIMLSQKVANNNKKEEQNIISSTLLYTIIVSIALVVIIELLLNPILHLMNTPIETFEFAKDYLVIYLIGIIPSYIFCHITAMLRCYGNTIFQMVSMLVTSIVNAILDPIFIKLIGFNGAAIATVISQVISLILVIIYCKKKNYFKISFKEISGNLIKPVAKLSIPTVIQQCTPSLSSTVLTTCVSNFGITAIAGYGILTKLDMLLFFPPMVMNMILTPIVGYCNGANRKDRAKDYINLSIKVSIALVIIFSIILLAFSIPIASTFGCSIEAAQVVQTALKYLVFGYLLNAITQCLIGHINGLGKPSSGMIITILNHIVIRIPFSIILSKTFLGLNGIWITLLISFILAFICSIIIDKHISKEKVMS